MVKNKTHAKLGDIGKVLMCKRILKSQTANTGEVPFFKISTFGGKADTFISQDLYAEYKREYSHPKKGDVLISAAGTVGKTVIYDGKPAYFQDSNIVWIENCETKVLNSYLYYFYQTEPWLTTKGSTITRIYNNDLRSIGFSYPLLTVQQKVVNVLSNIDKKITLNNKINTELEAMAKLIYDYWFVQFDFPDANGKPYKSSGGKMIYNEALKREIPDNWEGGSCSSLFKFNPTLSIKKGEIASHLDMNALPTSGYMTKNVKKKPFSGGMKFQNGDVVVARITPCLENGKTGLISLLDDNEIGFGSTEFIVLRGKSFDLKCFGACLARSEKFREFSISKMTGTSGRKRVNYTALELYKMPIPDETLLKDFEERIAPLFDKMTKNTRENQKLSEFRDWLLPMLMNGQVTVKDA
jgi:type I restriction enzyme S subunit